MINNKVEQQQSSTISLSPKQNIHQTQLYHTESPPYLDLDMERVNLTSCSYFDDHDSIYDLDLPSLLTSHQQQQQKQEAFKDISMNIDQHNNYINNHYHHHDDLARSPSNKSASLSSSYLSDYMSMQLDMHNLRHSHQNNIDINNSPFTQQFLSIEDLHIAKNSCSLCGCNWQQDHVSLDCSECGGYSLTRPCPECDGQCKTIWKRNIATTHDRHRDAWVGQCELKNKKLDSKKVAVEENISSPKDLCQALSGSQGQVSHIDDDDEDDDMHRTCPSPADSYDSGDYSSSSSPSPPQYRPQQHQQQQHQQGQSNTTNQQQSQLHRSTTNKILVTCSCHSIKQNTFPHLQTHKQTHAEP